MGGADLVLIDGQIDGSDGDRAEDGVYLEDDLVGHFAELGTPAIIEDSDQKPLLVQPKRRSDSGDVATDHAHPGCEYTLLDGFGGVARFSQDPWQQAGESFHSP